MTNPLKTDRTGLFHALRRSLARLGFITLLATGLVSRAVAEDPLEVQFRNPPASAKPHTWWHWMNGYVSGDGITKDLEAMARAGIGGFQAFQIERGMEPGPVKYLSAEWRELMTHAIREADRLGLEMCYHNCAGWSSSGGPWITPEHAMQTVVWTEQQVSGSKPVNVKLARPKKLRENYFQEIAVLAFPTPISEQGAKPGFRVENWLGKAGFERDNGIKPDTRKVDANDRIDPASIIDLSGMMKPDGSLRWDAPDGNWTIIRFGHAVGGLRNRPAPREGRGNECDKMSKTAAAWHWKHTVQKVIDDVGPLTGKAFRSVLIDSYETGQQNWTKGFENEFKKRMGYDLIRHLPALTGRVIGDLDHTERFLWDFRRAIADLWTENYYGHFAEMCHENGLLLACEPYGKPGNLDDFSVADVADIPMGEWWARTSTGPFRSSSKMAASAAHTNGRRVVGAEAFTAGRAGAAFINHPYHLKAQGDYFFCQGVNRFYFHTFVHQPWDDDVLPGMTMAVWGFQNNRNNTWYEKGRAWNEYLARSQFLLQEGNFQADLCYYPGENAPQASEDREKMKPAPPIGYDYDTISRASLMKLTVEDGRLVLPGLMEYRMLVMPSGPLRPGVAEKAAELIAAGGHVFWQRPERAPGLQGYPEADQKVRNIAEKIWNESSVASEGGIAHGKGRVYGEGSLDDILRSMSVLPAVEIRPAQEIAPTLYPGSGYEWIHRKVGPDDVFLISNQQEVAREIEVVLRDHGRVPQLWNAETGNIRDAPVYGSTADGRTFVKLFLQPAEAVFVVFRNKAPAASVVEVLRDGSKALDPDELSVSGKDAILTAWQPGNYELLLSDGKRRAASVEAVPQALDLSTGWSLHCPEGRGPAKVELDRLISWPEHSDPELKYFSGTAVYQKKFDVPAECLGDGHVARLDLGEVQVIAEVTLNGRNLGILWKPPFRLDLPDGLLKTRGNQLEVQVTNLWVNRLIGDEQHPATDTYIPDAKSGAALIMAIPGWLKSGQPRPTTKRKTFSTCKFYEKDSPLLESGLLGPVQLQFGVEKKFN